MGLCPEIAKVSAVCDRCRHRCGDGVAADRTAYDGLMGIPDGFEYDVMASGEVRIRHHGRAAGTLRGHAAASFLEDVLAGDPQELMARVTGNYRHGNERTAKQHPRNRNRER